MRHIVMVAAPVHPVPPKHGAAVEWWMYQVGRRLTQFSSDIVCTHAPGYALNETVERARIHRIQIGRLYRRLFQKITRLDPYSYGQRAARIVREIDAAIVHVHNAPALFHELTRSLDTKRHRFVLHMHNEMDIGVPAAGTSLVTCSRSLAQWYRARVDLPVEVVTNGVDTQAFATARAHSEQRQQLGIPAGSKVLLYAGRLSPEKGPLDLVHAFRELLQRRRDVYLILVGEQRRGDATDARVRYGNEIQTACETMRDRCRLVGAVDPTTMPDYYALADLVVVPSEFEEPFGMVALEAMAAGAPVLAARKGGLTEFIRDGETGFFIHDAKQHVQFARQMDELLAQPDHLHSVRDRARDYARAHHDWGEVVRQIEQVYARVLTP